MVVHTKIYRSPAAHSYFRKLCCGDTGEMSLNSSNSHMNVVELMSWSLCVSGSSSTPLGGPGATCASLELSVRPCTRSEVLLWGRVEATSALLPAVSSSSCCGYCSVLKQPLSSKGCAPPLASYTATKMVLTHTHLMYSSGWI